MSKILIIDDESDICFLISEILGDEKFISEKAYNSNQALSKYKEFNPDLIILDVWLGSSEFDGLELLSKFKDLNPLIPVIVISGHGNVDMAVSAIKMGAYDFIEKPFNSEKLIVTCKRAIESALLINENNKLKSIVSPSIPLIGKSSFILQLKKNINKIAESNYRVFISGSMGSGKKLLAKSIHQNSIYSENLCFVIDFKNIFQNELDILFSDSFKNIDKNLLSQANQTTLVLDNIDLLNINYQKKLLFFIENNNFYLKNNIVLKQKIISTSSKDIKNEILEGNFLQTLYDRLSVINIYIPEINLRRDDILPICEFYLNYYNKNKKLTFTFSKTAQTKLQLYDWPGNVSQIINYAEKTIILNNSSNNSDRLEIEDLPLDMGHYSNNETADKKYELSLRDARNNFEKDYLISQIKRFNGNIKKISDFTGMERTALYRKFKSLKIDINTI